MTVTVIDYNEIRHCLISFNSKGPDRAKIYNGYVIKSQISYTCSSFKYYYMHYTVGYVFLELCPFHYHMSLCSFTCSLIQIFTVQLLVYFTMAHILHYFINYWQTELK